MNNDDGKTILELDNGWSINLLYVYTGINETKEYLIKHRHEGYNWNVDPIYAGVPLLGRCIRCRGNVPEELLGFLELLRWNV